MATTALDYDALAADYAAHRRVHPGVLAALRDAAALGSNARVLEVGCGGGNYAAAIRRVAGCAVSGVDPSGEMLARAGAQDPALDLHRGRAESLPFPDAAFDLVFSVDVVHHVADRAAFFGEAARVLVPGGRLCTVTDSDDDIRRRIPLSSHWPETIPVERGRYPAIGTLRSEMTAAAFVGIAADHADLAYDLTDAAAYRDRAFSSLHLIGPAAFARGLAKLEADLAAGPIRAVSLYTLLWGKKPVA